MTDNQSPEKLTEFENRVIDVAQKQNLDMNSNVLTDISPQNTSDKPCGCENPSVTMPVAPNSYVYAIGRIQPRFPSPSVEKEFVQAIGRTETKGLTDREASYSVLSQK
jgi:hypothetical protein